MQDISTNFAEGHGLSNDISTPIEISGKQIVTEVKLVPAYFNFNTSNPTMLVRIFDQSTNQTISNLDYSIKVKSDNKSLLDICFRSSDGFFSSILIPDSKYNNSIVFSDRNNSPVNNLKCLTNNYGDKENFKMRSKILSSGGLFHFIVTMHKSSQGLKLDNEIQINLFISIGQDYRYELVDPLKKNSYLLIKSYYDKISNITYAEKSKTLSFKMPFNWDPVYLQQVPFLHLEFVFPKTIALANSNGYHGNINNQDVSPKSLLIDDYSNTSSRIVHILLNKDQLDQMSRKINQFSANQNTPVLTTFTISPIDTPKFPIDILTSTELYLFQISWTPAIITPKVPVNFVMNLQDPKTGDLIRHSSFDFIVFDKNNIIHNEHLQSSFGGFAFQYTFKEDISNKPTLIIDNINGGPEKTILNLSVNK